MIEQPHFEDELTKLTARPVVSLEEIEAKIKHRRRWFLSGAFALAMLLGAASALVSAYFKLRNVPDPETQTTAASTITDQEPATAEQPETASMMPVVEKVDEQPSASPTPTPAPKRPARVIITEHTNQPAIEPRLNEEDDLRRIRDSVLIDEWQERRARRVERRERREQRERRRAGRSGRDLSNLDEIFEGPRRPRS